MNSPYAYSIIIPHRNTPDLLLRCLRSIPERQDTEVIVADDKSDIAEAELQSIVASHPCAKLITLKESKGAGHARNVALSQATGHWLVFADADDYFTPAIADVLDKYAKDTETDMVFLNALSVDENGITVPTPLSLHIERYEKGRPLAEKVMRYATWTPWSRMLKRSLVEQNNLRFEEVPVGNDAMFVLRCTSLAKHISAESTPCYMYFQPSAGSQTWHQYTDNTLLQRIELRFKINNLYRQVGYPFLWPVTSKVKVKDLDSNQRKELSTLCSRYHHSQAKEIRARCSQLFGKIAGCL